MAENLPPGVSESMIPGNRTEDAEWDLFYEEIDADCSRLALYPQEALNLWKEAIKDK